MPYEMLTSLLDWVEHAAFLLYLGVISRCLSFCPSLLVLLYRGVLSRWSSRLHRCRAILESPPVFQVFGVTELARWWSLVRDVDVWTWSRRHMTAPPCRCGLASVFSRCEELAALPTSLANGCIRRWIEYLMATWNDVVVVRRLAWCIIHASA